MTQEVITASEAKAAREYRDQLDKYEENQRSGAKNIWLLAPLAVLLWVMSFLAAGPAAPDSGRGYWYAWFAICSFGAAGLVTVMAIGTAFGRNLALRPSKPHRD